MKAYFKLFFITAIGISLFLLFSCEDSNLQNTKMNPINGELPLDDLADIFIYTTAGKDYCQFYEKTDTNSVNVFAYITDGFDFVNPTSVVANNSSLTNMDGYVGQYGGLVTPFPQGPPYNITWNIDGWMGRNYSGIQEISHILDFTNLNYLDTVSASSNLNISYSGFENTDSVSVYIGPGISENMFILNIPNTSSRSNGEYKVDVPDNGNIIIPASALSALTSNLYYSISISNYKQSEEQFFGSKIIKKSLYEVSTVFFLTK